MNATDFDLFHRRGESFEQFVEMGWHRWADHPKQGRRDAPRVVSLDEAFDDSIRLHLVLDHRKMSALLQDDCLSLG